MVTLFGMVTSSEIMLLDLNDMNAFNIIGEVHEFTTAFRRDFIHRNTRNSTLMATMHQYLDICIDLRHEMMNVG